MSETIAFLMQRIEALEAENKRLKTTIFETRLSDSTMTNPNEIEVNYQLVNPN